MTKTQQAALDIIRANGGSIVRFNFGWDNGVKINVRVVHALQNAGYLKSIALPPRGPQQIVPVKYIMVHA